jgi:UDP-N-acetyl-2-amino-2-deoxyglucuronate dehydrogenase
MREGMAEPLSIALVGCGRIAQKHFEVFEQLPDLRLCGVCDLVAERARAAGDKYKVPAFAELEEMFEKTRPQVVAICTPSGLHPAHGIAAAKRGVHVVSEKPMATRLRDADALVEACDQARVHLFVIKQNRLNPPVQLVRRALDKERFGRLYLASAHVLWARPQAYYDSAKWRGTWEFDGGAFMNQASHYVDLIQWLGGPVESVIAKTATLARHIETEDTGAAVLRFRNGAIGVIEVTMLTYPRNLEGSVTLIGEKGTARIGGTAVNRIEAWQFADYDDDDKLVEAAQSSPPTVYGFGHKPYYENVVKVLRGEAEPGTDGRDGRKSLELILAIYESAKTGREVPLPLRNFV